MKTVLNIVLRACKTVSIRPCISREYKIKISKFSYTVIVVAITLKFLAVVTPPYIYHGFSTRKTFWEEKFTPMNIKSCGRRNFRKHGEINNDEKYTGLEFSLNLNCMDKK